MSSIDRYAITFKGVTKYFHTHEEALVYVLTLPMSTDRIDIQKFGSWQKVLINITGEINEIQRLVKIVAEWKKLGKSKK